MVKLDTIFILISIIAFISIFVFIIRAFIQIIKKDREKSKKMFKFSGIALAVTIAGLIGVGATADETEVVEKGEAEVKEDAKKESEPETKETAEEKAAREATEKAEADKKAKAEADAKAKEKADKLAAEKEFYLKNVKTAVDTQMGMYDKAWSEIWQPTFEGIGTTVDVYTAYDNMKLLEQRYDTLYSSIGAIDGSGLSKQNEKTFKEFKTNMKNAAMWRGEAAEKARKMFDEGDYSPSRMDKMKTDISYADNEMMKAVISLTSLEATLGVDRDE